MNKYVTSTTEKKINNMIESNNQYAEILLKMLNDMKSLISCYGATIKEIESWQLHIDNEEELKACESDMNILRGMAITFEKYIGVRFTHDLRTIVIKDLNELVKECEKV